MPPIVFDCERGRHAVPIAARRDAIQADADVVRRHDVVVAAADQLDAVSGEAVNREPLDPGQRGRDAEPGSAGPEEASVQLDQRRARSSPAAIVPSTSTESVICGSGENGRIVAGPPTPTWKLITSLPPVPLDASIASRSVQSRTSQTPSVPSPAELTVKDGRERGRRSRQRSHERRREDHQLDSSGRAAGQTRPPHPA